MERRLQTCSQPLQSTAQLRRNRRAHCSEQKKMIMSKTCSREAMASRVAQSNRDYRVTRRQAHRTGFSDPLAQKPATSRKGSAVASASTLAPDNFASPSGLASLSDYLGNTYLYNIRTLLCSSSSRRLGALSELLRAQPPARPGSLEHTEKAQENYRKPENRENLRKPHKT